MSKIKAFLMKFNFRNVNIGAWVRGVLYILSFVNVKLVQAGYAPVPAEYEDVYMGVAIAIAFIVGLVGYWKNNSFTEGAQEADRFLHDKKVFDGGLTDEEARIVKAELEEARKLSADVTVAGEEPKNFKND